MLEVWMRQSYLGEVTLAFVPELEAGGTECGCSVTEVEDSILFPDVTVGRHARVRGAIIDTGVEIPEGTVIGFDVVRDRERFTITEKGRVVVTSVDLICDQYERPNSREE
jgi:NDP-sugar pyrophosphorylase family protein